MKEPKVIIQCEFCGNNCFTGFHCPCCDHFNPVMQETKSSKLQVKMKGWQGE